VPPAQPSESDRGTGRDAERAVTQREFARQASSFERAGSVFAAGEILDWICEHVAVGASDIVLDVAGGTGQLGRRLALRAAFALVIDLTPEMLREGARAARQQDAGNVVFLAGDATQLPFADEQLDLVVSRFALHHITDAARAAAEMARVCRRGGTVAIIDMACEPGESGRRHNELERLRDPSHARALAEDELSGILIQAGVSAGTVGERRQRMPVTPWLDQAQPAQRERQRVLAALQAEIDGGPASGLRAGEEEGGLRIEQRWLIVAGERA